MNTEEEFRRQRLIDLINRLGRGGVAHIAEQIGVDPTYVSRMKSDPSSKQHRPITGDTVLSIEKAFPGWLSATPSSKQKSETITEVYKKDPHPTNLPAQDAALDRNIRHVDFAPQTERDKQSATNTWPRSTHFSHRRTCRAYRSSSTEPKMPCTSTHLPSKRQGHLNKRMA